MSSADDGLRSYAPRRHTARVVTGFAALGIVAGGLAAVVAGSPAGQTTSAGSDPVTAVTLIHGIAGREKDLKQHLLSLAGPTRAEPGCLRYDLYQSSGQPHEFMRLEVWSSSEALEAHKKTPHLKASFEKRQKEGWSTQILTWRRVREDAGATGAASEGHATAPAARIERLDPRLDAIIPPGAVPQKVGGGLSWAEGPLWDRRDGSLLVSDVPRNEILRWRSGAGIVSFIARSGYTGRAPFTGPEPGSNGLAFDGQGRLVMCQHGDRRIARREEDGGLTVLADRYQGMRLNSPNDLVYRRNGDLYFTDPPFGLPGSFSDPAKEIPFQGVYRLTSGGRLDLVVKDLNAPNGIAFSPDESILYVSNAEHAQPIWMAYPVLADGTVGPGRRIAEAYRWVEEGEGVPDGLKVDALGNLFAAGPGGVHVIAPDGTRLGRIETGVKTGNVAWGEDGSTLFIAAGDSILRLRTGTRAAEWKPGRSAVSY